MKVDDLPKQITILKTVNILLFFLSLHCVFFKVSAVLNAFLDVLTAPCYIIVHS